MMVISQKSFCIECIEYFHYSLILRYFVAKSNIIFSFQIKLLATFDHIRDRKNAWEWSMHIEI